MLLRTTVVGVTVSSWRNPWQKTVSLFLLLGRCPSSTVSISWHEGSVFCTDRVVISQATDIEETISPPIKVSKGQAMINLKDKCKLYTIRLAALLPGKNEVSCSPLSISLLCTASWCTHPASWSGSPPCSPPSLSCQIWPLSTFPWSVPLQRWWWQPAPPTWRHTVYLSQCQATQRHIYLVCPPAHSTTSPWKSRTTPSGAYRGTLRLTCRYKKIGPSKVYALYGRQFTFMPDLVVTMEDFFLLSFGPHSAWNVQVRGGKTSIDIDLICMLTNKYLSLKNHNYLWSFCACNFAHKKSWKHLLVPNKLSENIRL